MTFGQMAFILLMNWQEYGYPEANDSMMPFSPAIWCGWLILCISVFVSVFLLRNIKVKVTLKQNMICIFYLIFQLAVLIIRHIQSSNSRYFILASAIGIVVFSSYLYTDIMYTSIAEKMKGEN